MKNFELSFLYITGTASLGAAVTVSCDGSVTVSLAYDFRERPLTSPLPHSPAMPFP